MGLPNRVFHSGATSESHISLLHGLSKIGFSGGLRQVALAEVLQAAVTGGDSGRCSGAGVQNADRDCVYRWQLLGDDPVMIRLAADAGLRHSLMSLCGSGWLAVWRVCRRLYEDVIRYCACHRCGRAYPPKLRNGNGDHSAWLSWHPL